MSQPPLSQAIRKLEDELGVRLFERTSRIVVPTVAAGVLADEARRVLAGVEFALAEARRAGAAGATLRIGCVPHLPFEKLQRFLGGLRAAEPEVHPEVSHMLSLEQVACLRSGELDLGIFHRAADHDGIETKPLFAGEPLMALLPLDHPLAGRATLGPDELLGETLLVFPRSAYPAAYDHVITAAEEVGYRFDSLREAGGTSGRDLVLAAAEGLGIAIGPLNRDDLGTASAAVVAIRLDPGVAMPEIAVGWRDDPPRLLRPLLATVQRVADELQVAPGGAAFHGGRPM